MGALVFTEAAKNAYLDHLVGKSTAAHNYTFQYLQIKDSSNNKIGSHAPSWATPVAGVSAMADATISPSNSGTAASIQFYTGMQEYFTATGTPSLASGGGNLILSSLSFTYNGDAVTAKCVLKMPRSNGGTLHFNEALANAFLSMMMGVTPSGANMSGGTLSFYSGTQPATADTAIGSQTLLGSLDMPATRFNAASGGIITLASTNTTTSVASGPATWARWVNGSLVMDLSVGTTGADITVNTTSFDSNYPYNVSMTGLTLTIP